VNIWPAGQTGLQSQLQVEALNCSTWALQLEGLMGQTQLQFWGEATKFPVHWPAGQLQSQEAEFTFGVPAPHLVAGQLQQHWPDPSVHVPGIRGARHWEAWPEVQLQAQAPLERKLPAPNPQFFWQGQEQSACWTSPATGQVVVAQLQRQVKVLWSK
jgi:hypothetical protein